MACGVRKKWYGLFSHLFLNVHPTVTRAKEFEGMEDKPKKQIAHLKSILSDLGMTGRLSMEKAKTIKAKRELADEIGS